MCASPSPRLVHLYHANSLISISFLASLLSLQVLSDEDKRHTYDMTGEVGDSPKPAGHPHGNSFTVFTTGNGFQFRFFTGGSAHRGDSISTDAFFNNILPNSHHKPYLINFYTDFCMQCGHVEQLWNDMRKVYLHAVP